MIHIQFNDEKILLEQKISLAEILNKRGYVDSHFAVALNRQFIPRSQYTATHLDAGDVIEIISPMQGG